MKKKTVLITGASYGIGLGIAKNFNNEIYNLIISSRSKKNLINAKYHLKNKNITNISCDFESEKNVKIFFKKLKKKIDKIDIIICNVGSGKTSKSGEENYSVWQKMFNKNFFSTTNVVESYLKIFKEKTKNTKIIIIGSIAGKFRGNAPLSYSIAKNCLINYVDHISPILAKKKIRINSISPGHVLIKGNNWHKKLMKNKNKTEKFIRNSVSLKKFCSINDINNCVNFIISDKSDYINGINLEVDGKTI